MPSHRPTRPAEAVPGARDQLPQNGAARCRAPPSRSVSSVNIAPADVGEVHDPRGQLGAADAQQRAGRARLQEHVQAVRSPPLFTRAGASCRPATKALIRARRLSARHARDLDRARQTDDEIEMAGGQAGMLPLRNIAHATASVVRDERTQRQRRRGDGTVVACHRAGIVADSKVGRLRDQSARFASRRALDTRLSVAPWTEPSGYKAGSHRRRYSRKPQAGELQS